MDAFSYLSVLLSVIVGLAVTQVLQGYRALMLARARVRWDMPPLVWSVLLLIGAVQFWWASFGLTTHANWTFAAFAVLLIQAGLLYMLTAICLPDVAAGEAVDLAEHYRREARPLFALFLLLVLASLAKDWVLDGQLTDPRNLAFHIAFAAIALIGLTIRRRAVDVALAALLIALFTLYIVLLFARL